MRRTLLSFCTVLVGAAVGCADQTLGPAPPGVRPTEKLTAGQEIVASGVRASATEWLAAFFTERGDDVAARELAAIRARHAAVLDSVALASRRAPARVFGPRATSSSSRSWGDHATLASLDDETIMEYPDIVLSTELYGLGHVYNAHTYPTVSGSSGNLLGTAAYRGNRVEMTLVRETENLIGNRPDLSSAQITRVKSDDPEAFIDCVLAHALQNTTIAESNDNIVAHCGTGSYLSSYSEDVWPNIPLGQPCGTNLYGHGVFRAFFAFASIANLISSAIDNFSVIVGDIGDVGHSPLETTLPKIAYNGNCSSPVVEARIGGNYEQIGPGQFVGYISPGEIEVGLHLYATRLYEGLPAANAYRILLDGVEVAASSNTYEYFWEGSFYMAAMLTDNLLGLADTSYATIYVEAEPAYCDDPYAPNYGASEWCVYPEDYCWDPDASNYGEYGFCSYPDDPYCEDWEALNYGEYGECDYGEEGYCWDWDANNYGEYGQCEYDDWPPDPCEEWPEQCDPCSDWYTGWEECEDPCSDWYSGWEECEDPCSDWYFGDEPCEDPCSEWYYGDEPCECEENFNANAAGRSSASLNGIPPEECDDWWNSNAKRGITPLGQRGSTVKTLAVSTSSTAGTVSFRELRAKSARKASATRVKQARREAVAARLAQSSYVFMLLDRWQDATTLAMVGRYKHGSQFIDVIYLPAKNPTSIGWAQAVRVLQQDRQSTPRASDTHRVVRIHGNGAVKLTKKVAGQTKVVTAKAGTPLSLATQSRLDQSFKARLLPALRSAPLKTTAQGNGVRTLRWSPRPTLPSARAASSGAALFKK